MQGANCGRARHKDNKGATPLDYADKVPSNEAKPVLVLWLLKNPPAKPAKKN